MVFKKKFNFNTKKNRKRVKFKKMCFFKKS